MKILIEVRGGIVESVFCDEPQDVEVVVRDFDDIGDGDDDPVKEKPWLKELRTPPFAVY